MNTSTPNLSVLPSPPDLAGAVARARSLSTELRAAVVERDAEVRSLLVALVAGEHVLLLGPPGTAKSLLAKLLCGAIGNADGLFELLMTKYTVPEEVFGPYSLAGLERDEYRRVLAGYLATADVAFLDEIFKANSSILNALLSVLNERVFDNGGVRGTVPLRLCVGASNELAQDDGLAALSDRFLLKHWVAPIKERASRKRLLGSAAEPAVTTKLSNADVDALRVAAEAVAIPDDVLDLVLDLGESLEREHGITASDRRWRRAMRLVRASAALDGRDRVIPRDLSILTHALWRTTDERAAVAASVATAVSPKLGEAIKLYDAAVELYGKMDPGATGSAATTALANLNTELIKVGRQIKALGADVDPDLAEYADKVTAMQRDVGARAARLLGFGNL